MKISKLVFLAVSVLAMMTLFGTSIILATTEPLSDAPSQQQAAKAVDLSGSSKTVNSTTAIRGDTLTYTIIISNSGNMSSTVTVTDIMPSVVESGVVYFPTTNGGTVNLPGGTTNLPGTGSANLPGGTDWVWTGVISPASQLEIVLVVELETGFWDPVTFTNRVDINNGMGNVITRYSEVTTYDPKTYLYLPIVMKNYPVSLPPAACTPSLLAEIDVGSQPRGVALDTARNLVYVANYGDNSVAVINRNTYQVVQTINGVSSPHGVAYDPTNDTIWVTNIDTDQVTPIDGNSYAVGTPVGVGDMPSGIIYNPVDQNVYVANRGSDTVSVLNAGGTVSLPISVGDQPLNLVAHPTTGVVYVTNYGSNNVSVLNAGGTVVLPIGVTGSNPYDLDIDVSRGYLYVSSLGGSIETISTNTNQSIGATPITRRGTNPNVLVPMRAFAVNGDLGSGHLWTVTSKNDYSNPAEGETKILVIPKGYDDGFNFASPYPYGAGGSITSPATLEHSDIAFDHQKDYAFYSLPNLNQVWVMGDAPGYSAPCGDTYKGEAGY